MNEYMPTTEEVRANYVANRMVFIDTTDPSPAEEFDRWLAAHDAQVRADVLNDVADDWAADPDSWGDNEKDYRNELRDRADAYRAEGVEPKPWEEAKDGEIWVLTSGGVDLPWTRQADQWVSNTPGKLFRRNVDLITAGRRIWPVS